ncbi:hypothetical protein NQ317_011788 [Molorchus minor]|uniref:Protein hunchback n=1 Tax=Molorchus minor TaxID=1323400 RepID=A0ABQ9J7Q2_9CUCU|nr:hypothetical protein NQ317_011788 [Molorchus minor]
MYKCHVYQMDPVICASCVETLTIYNNFATICEGTEEKVKLYRDVRQSEARPKLSDILKFLTEGTPYNDVIKEEDTFEDTKCSRKESGTKIENTIHNGRFKNHLLVHKKIPKKVKEETYKCAVCEFQTKYRASIRRHVLRHKNNSEVQMYKCKKCEYTTKHTDCLRKHSLIHKDISEAKTYRCAHCEFQTNYRGTLVRHLLIHDIGAVVYMYKCPKCEHQTKHKRDLIRHRYTCINVRCVSIRRNLKKAFPRRNCVYQTKHKDYLKSHMRIHVNCAQPMHKYEVCEYQTKYKVCIKKHMLVVEEPNWVELKDDGILELLKTMQRDLELELNLLTSIT